MPSFLPVKMQPMLVLPLVRGPSVAGSGSSAFEELDRHDLVALKLDRGGGQHADVLQTLHVGQIGLTEGHEEADALHARNILRQGLDLLVVEQVHVLVADLIEVVLALDAHRRDFNPVTVLPVRAGRGYLTQIDLRVEVGRKRVAVVAAVAVQDVDGVDFIEQVLLCVSAVRLRYARSKPEPSSAVRPASSNFFL